ncbi:MAG TPA: PAS domain S-box protein [Prolixibacteraceae bacterium]|nr:PAS domain S-box protein [Prolixibacteraceae bacterium]
MENNELNEKTIQELNDENQRLKKQLEELQNKQPQFNDYHLIAEAQDIGKLAYWRYSFTEKKIVTSENFNKLLELKKTDDITNIVTIKRILPSHERPKIKDFLSQIKDHKQNIEFVFHLIMKDGSSRYMELKAKTEGRKPQPPTAVLGIISDITETNYRIEKLRGNEKLFKNLFSNLTDIFIIFEIKHNNNGDVIDYIYRDVNPSYENQFGIEKNDIINRTLSTQPQLFQQFNPYLKNTALTGEPQQDRFYIQTLDQFIDVLIYSPTPNTIATVWRDVSLTVKAETSLRESEEKYRQIFNIGYDGVLIVDLFSAKIIDVNTSFCNMIGLSKQEMLKQNFKDIINEPSIFDEDITNNKANQITGNFYKSNGQLLPFEASLSYFNWSGYRVILISARNISERIATQRELVNSEKKYKQLFEYSNDAIFIIKNFRIVDYNQKSVQLFKTLSANILNKTLWSLSPQQQKNGKDSRETIAEQIQTVLQGKQIEIEWLFQRDDKSIFLAELKLSPIVIEEDKFVQAIISDIGDKKELQEALAFNELRWKEALDIGNTGVWEWNIDTNEVFFSRIWKKILGFEKDELPNKFEEFNKRIHPDDTIELFDKINAYITGKISEFNADFRMRCKNGSYKWINSKGKINSYTNEGKPEKFFGVHTDITRHVIERINTQAKNERYSEAEKLIHLGLWELNIKTMVISGSNETFAMLGFENTDRLTLKQLESIVHPEDQPNFITQFNAGSNNQSQLTSFRIIVDNNTRYIQSFSIVVNDSNGRIEGFRGVFQDISNLKKQEIVFKEEQNLMNTLLDKTQQTIIIASNQEIVHHNDKFFDLTGYTTNNYSPAINTFADLVMPEDKPLFNKLFTEIEASKNQSQKIDIRIENKFKRLKWIEVLSAPIKYKGQNSVLLVISEISTRKKKEIDLEKSHYNLFNMAQSSPIAIAFTDLQGKMSYANPEFMMLTGIKNEQINKTELQQLFNETEYFNINNAFISIKNRLSKDYHSETNLKNGLVVKIKVEPIYDLNNNITDFIIYLNNIDIQKKQIEILSEENNMIKTLVENASAGLGVFDENEELIIYNQTLLNIANLDFLNKTAIHFSDLKLQHKNKHINFKDIIINDQSIAFDYQPSPNKITYIEVKPVKLGDKKGIMFIIRDITETFKRNAVLIEQLEKYKTIFESVPYGCALIDKNRNIIFSNLKYAQLLEYSLEEIKFKKLDQIIHTDFLSESVTKFSELFSGVIPNYTQQYQIITKHNKTRWINSKSTTFNDKFNEIIYAIHIIEDISDIKENEYQVLNHERIQTLNHIANSFAHSFNNQLMSIYGNSFLLRTNINDEKLKNFADMLLASIQKTSELTQNLLSFSKNKSKIDIKTNMNKLIEDLLDQTYIPPTIMIRTSFEHKNENILGDPTLLHKALNNIIENACNAMPNGGDLLIETKSVYFENEDETLKKGKYFRIAITDNGKGISSANLPKIFDPFFTTKNEEFYAGLGLTISMNIIKEHQGAIKVQSETGLGTSVMIYLPQQNEEFLHSIPQPDEQLIIKGSANLMIIDDEDVVRIITGELLKKLGYNVFSFSSGKKAINFYKSNFKNIDLVILDKQMPEMDGITVYSQLKEIKPQIKAILLTGFNIDQHTEGIFVTDNNLVVQKPVSVEKLSQAISKLLQIKA